jgi:pentatricopeptide repeat protein
VKCGDFGGAARLFDDMEERNLVSWNSIIIANAVHGQSEL